jgi:HPt (histidine-containing phosphotransfer) domain-containing protein/CheY-like chemotaxis protein
MESAPEDGLKILLAESNASQSHDRVDQLRSRGHHIQLAQSGFKLLSAIDRESYDIVLINLDQPAASTAELEATGQKLAAQARSVLGVTSRTDSPPPGAPCPNVVTWNDLPKRLNELTARPASGQFFPTINIQAALECTDGDAELLQSLIELYFEQEPGLLAQIRASIERRDADLLERSAHSLKGSISVFAAADARQAAFILENIGRESSWDSARAALENLERELTRFGPDLRSLNVSISRGDFAGR